MPIKRKIFKKIIHKISNFEKKIFTKIVNAAIENNLLTNAEILEYLKFLYNFICIIFTYILIPSDQKKFSICKDNRKYYIRKKILIFCYTDEICSICLDKKGNTKIKKCGHTFCRKCIEHWLILLEKNICPFCRQKLIE